MQSQIDELKGMLEVERKVNGELKNKLEDMEVKAQELDGMVGEMGGQMKILDDRIKLFNA